jgi:hypothetical protein
MTTFTMMMIEIHQLEGFDPQGRSFNRNAEVYRSEKGFSARFQYEGVHAESATFVTIAEAVADLVRTIQRKGFRKLRTRVNFRGKRYLAERQSWVDYPDLKETSGR